MRFKVQQEGQQQQPQQQQAMQLAQRPLRPHVPWVSPLHSLADPSSGQRRSEQSVPFHPLWHAHTPSARHVPWLEQREGQVGSSHVCPAHPSSQTHRACVGASRLEKRGFGGRRCGAVAVASAGSHALTVCGASTSASRTAPFTARSRHVFCTYFCPSPNLSGMYSCAKSGVATTTRQKARPLAAEAAVQDANVWRKRAMSLAALSLALALGATLQAMRRTAGAGSR